MGENRFNGWRDEGPDLERVAAIQAKNAEGD